MEGFYKFDGENWYYAPNFVYAKDYILEKDGNREFRFSLNKYLIKENSPFKFGNIDETISSVLGKNQRFGHLTKFGKVICKILDTIDKNHCEKSIVW